MLSKVKTMYLTYTQANYSRKEMEMQDEEMKALLAKACMFPCRLLANVIEMEHRVNGEDYEELVDTAAKQLTRAIEMEKIVPDIILADEAQKMEMVGLLYGMSADTIAELIMPGLEAKMADMESKMDDMKEGAPDVM